jgi:hypothetical protein
MLNGLVASRAQNPIRSVHVATINGNPLGLRSLPKAHRTRGWCFYPQCQFMLPKILTYASNQAA